MCRPFSPARRTLARFAAPALGCLLPALIFAQTAPADDAARVAEPANASATPRPNRPVSPKEQAVQLSVFTVSEEKDVGYESMQTTAGLRTAQELKNVANSISVMNSQFMEDLAIIDIGEASKWMVTGEESPDPAQPNQLVLRGIRNSYALRNGWIWYSPMDAFATERIELLRGPNAFLYGEADLGGANNLITKRGLFTRNVTRTKLMVGSNNFRRVELDLNRRFGDKLAGRISAVQSNTDSWIDHVRQDFRGIYGAVTYRPFRSTAINFSAEHSKSTSVAAQGLFLDQFSFTTGTNLTNTAGVVYNAATGALFRANGMRRSAGGGLGIVNPGILPKSFQTTGPNSTNQDFYDTFSFEVEHNIGKNLHLLLSGILYYRNIDNWGAAATRTVYRDLSATLPGGAINPYFNELYTEYFRIRTRNGNTLRAGRFSAVYDLNMKWMKQQFIVNVQQQQDNPKHWAPNWGEYVKPGHPAFVGAINPALTQAAFLANRTTLTNNRFMRRYYLRDGAGAQNTADLGPVAGVSAWYPDLSNAVSASGEQKYRRFYTPSVGVGASGSYFNNHLFTLVGFRRDHFNMKTLFGAPRALENEWVVDEIAAFNNEVFAQYKVDGKNYGVILRLNDTFAFGYNRAQSFRISAGEGNPAYLQGQRQGMQTGEGQDLSARLSLLGGRLELNTTYYDNFQPNARFAPAPAIAIRDEIAAIFPTTFNSAGQDLQTTRTKGVEVEMVANITRAWRLMFNAATNKVVTEDRAPFLKSFQAGAKGLNQPTPLLDAFLLTIPDGVPNAGYTKLRANFFTRYSFSQGRLKGFYAGGGANWRDQTFRGNAVAVQGGPVVALWSPSYYIVTALAGYQTKLFNRPTSFAVNISNFLDKSYYLSATTTTGSWGAPRAWRLTMITDF
ncbi:MAG: hypothetical protein RIQ93_1004 [Verrucomicrobiota bacterium]|jgi:outer membrane receptor for ferric coprogen and ferric-rhodotorulic acid